ncbi:hypothetical protein MD484_g2152, partial [Candolleomyces efflorescens]
MADRRPGAVFSELHLAFPMLAPSSSNRPLDDAFMNTVDTRFAGHLAYKVTFERQRKDAHVDVDDLNETETIFESYTPEQERAQESFPVTPIAPQPAPSANEHRSRVRPPRSFRALRLLRALYHELGRAFAALFGRRV